MMGNSVEMQLGSHTNIALVYCHSVKCSLSLCCSSVSSKSDSLFIPHEFACLNHSVLSAAHKYAPPTDHTHFTLRQQPQASVQLRNEILQKG